MEVLVFPKNEEKALQMEKYMKNLFPFAGVPKPERALLQQPLLDESKHLYHVLYTFLQESMLSHHSFFWTSGNNVTSSSKVNRLMFFWTKSIATY